MNNTWVDVGPGYQELTILEQLVKPKKEKLTTSNPTVYNRLKRLELSCPHCKPHKNENQGRRSKHGATTPKRKDKR